MLAAPRNAETSGSTITDGLNNFSMNLYDSNWTWIDSSNGWEGNIDQMLSPVAAGDYFLELYSWSDTAILYDLSMTIGEDTSLPDVGGSWNVHSDILGGPFAMGDATATVADEFVGGTEDYSDVFDFTITDADLGDGVDVFGAAIDLVVNGYADGSAITDENGVASGAEYVSLYFYDSNWNWVGSSYDWQGSTQDILAPVTAGDYFVEVYSWAEEALSYDISLTVGADTSIPDPAGEWIDTAYDFDIGVGAGNSDYVTDTTLAASDDGYLSPGESYEFIDGWVDTYDDWSDYYFFSVDELSSISIDAYSDTYDFGSIDLYDSDGYWIDSSWNYTWDANTKSIDISLQPGDYYASVYGWYEDISYDLTITSAAGGASDIQLDPGDTFETALSYGELSQGDFVTSIQSVGSDDWVDIYQFSLKEYGDVDIVMDGLSANA